VSGDVQDADGEIPRADLVAVLERAGDGGDASCIEPVRADLCAGEPPRESLVARDVVVVEVCGEDPRDAHAEPLGLGDQGLGRRARVDHDSMASRRVGHEVRVREPAGVLDAKTVNPWAASGGAARVASRDRDARPGPRPLWSSVARLSLAPRTIARRSVARLSLARRSRERRGVGRRGDVLPRKRRGTQERTRREPMTDSASATRTPESVRSRTGLDGFSRPSSSAQTVMDHDEDHREHDERGIAAAAAQPDGEGQQRQRARSWLDAPKMRHAVR
jgi:hypothetical protein